MNILQQAEQLLAQMTAAEKAQLLQRIIQESAGTFPGIEHSPDTLGGDARIVRTRIPVWLLVEAQRQGLSDSQILDAYPSLRPEDLSNAWFYAKAHATELEKHVNQHEAA